MQIQRDLMRYARRDTGERASKAGLQAAMQMSTQDPFYLRMTGNDRLKSLRMA